MFYFTLYSAFMAVNLGLSYSKEISIRKITVMASVSKPFIFHENKSLKGMEIELINGFANKFELNVDYIVANESLKEVFNNVNRSNQFMQSTEHLFVTKQHQSN